MGEDAMLRFLVAIDHTVESSFALRAACRLAKERGGYLEALHVLGRSAPPRDYGAGWAIHTYKRERMKDAYLDMGGVIASEKEAYETVPDLKVVSGNVVKEIAKETSEGSFDFLFMGSVHPLEGTHRGILLRLLPKVSCPIVVLRHYRPLKKVLLFVEDEQTSERAAAKAGVLFKRLPVRLDLVSQCEPSKETMAREVVGKVREQLEPTGLEVGARVLQGDPTKDIPELAPDYDLVIFGIARRKKPGPLVMKMLQSMQAPLMLCP